MLRGTPELWPSPWPGAPSTNGSYRGTPGFCDVPSRPSTSDPRAITGLPLPHRAVHPVGIPATFSSMLNPFFARMPVQYRFVSVSWKPGSAKEKRLSTICWVSAAIPSISAASARLRVSSRASAALTAAGFAFPLAGAFACAAAGTDAARSIVTASVHVPHLRRMSTP